LEAEMRVFWSYILLSISGCVEAGVGLVARHWLRHRCRLATLGVILAGLVNIIAGLGAAGWSGIWPQNWPGIDVLGKPVPLPHIILPFAALAISLMACRFQMFAFLMVGLGGLGFSIHVLGHLYFLEVTTWPKI